MSKSKIKAAAALAGALLLLTGCGSEGPSNQSSNVLTPLPGSPAAPGTAAAGSLADAIRGNYSGKLSKIVQHYNQAPAYTTEQPYSLNLAIVGCPQKADAQCVQAVFQTHGEAGNVPNHTIYMSYLGYTTGTNNAQIHVLQQFPAAKIPGFYDSKFVALELRVALNGTTYDQAQSKTRVMDCVLSQGAYTCRSDVSNVRFVSGLVKS